MSIDEDELPVGWCASVMGELAEVVGGGTPKASDPENFADAGHPWITPADLSEFSGTHVTRGRRSLSAKGLRSCSAKLVPRGSVLLSSRAPIGYVAVAANEVCTNQGFKSFVCKPDIVPEFVYHWLRFTRDSIEEMGSGSTFLEISGSRCKDIPIAVAPLAEQKRIVVAVDRVNCRVNAARERLGRVPSTLRRFRQAVLAAACSGRLTADWRKANPDIDDSRQLLARILRFRMERWQTNSPKRAYREPSTASPDNGELPATWCHATFDECAEDITVGHVGPMKERYVDTGILFLRSQNVRPFRFDRRGLMFIPADFHAALKKSRLVGGEVLVVRSGANTGDCCVFPSGLGEANCADLVITRPLPGLEPSYAAIYINSPVGQAALDLRQTGMAQPHFNIGAMREKPFPLPPLAEQQEIVRRVSALLAKADAIEANVVAARERINAIRQSTLAKAFRGELVPTEAELARREGRDYETASALLDRIRAERATTTPAANGRHGRRAAR